jgi:hypothetical protein
MEKKIKRRARQEDTTEGATDAAPTAPIPSPQVLPSANKQRERQYPRLNASRDSTTLSLSTLSSPDKKGKGRTREEDDTRTSSPPLVTLTTQRITRTSADRSTRRLSRREEVSEDSQSSPALILPTQPLRVQSYPEKQRRRCTEQEDTDDDGPSAAPTLAAGTHRAQPFAEETAKSRSPRKSQPEDVLSAVVAAPKLPRSAQWLRIADKLIAAAACVSEALRTESWRTDDAALAALSVCFAADGMGLCDAARAELFAPGATLSEMTEKMSARTKRGSKYDFIGIIQLLQFRAKVDW